MTASHSIQTRRLVVLVVLTVLLGMLPAGAAWAAPGELDATFSEDGMVLTAVANQIVGEAVAIQGDGKTVVGGYVYRRPPDCGECAAQYDFMLARYTADGSLDPSFGVEGLVIVDLSGQRLGDQIFDIALQADGKIVAVGTQDTSSAADPRLVVARFTAAGELDATFGENQGWSEFANGNAMQGRAVAIQSDGKIVAGGHWGDWGGEGLSVIRLAADGSLDDSFGSGGYAQVNFPGGTGRGQDLALAPGGEIVIAGEMYDDVTRTYDMAVGRLTSAGSLDTTFGGDGGVNIDFSTYDAGEIYDYSSDGAFGVAVQDDGKVVVAGHGDAQEPEGLSTGEDFAVARLTAAGALDISFDDDGRRTTAFSTGNDYDQAYELALQSDGKIVLAGVSNPNNDFGLVRYNTDGSLDETFGTSGLLSTDVGGGSGGANDLAIGSDGRLTAAGRGGDNASVLGVARYLGDEIVVPTVDLTVTKTGDGSGTVTSDPAGIDCGTECTHAYEQGTVVTLTALPDANVSFTGWSGDCTGAESCEVTLDATRSVSANFQPTERALTVVKGGDGAGVVTGEGIDCGADCTEAYAHGTSVELTASPASGSTFGGWQGCTSIDGGVCSVDMTADTNVTATFEEDAPPPPPPAPAPSPSVSPSPSPSPSPDGPVTISIDDVVITEADSDQDATFTVSLSRASSQEVWVDFSTADGSARQPLDYTFAAWRFRFSPGETVQRHRVVVRGDAVFELEEAFVLRLWRASGATVADATGQVTIVNDDPGCPGYESSQLFQIVGTKGNDYLSGSEGPDIICGLGGKDVINGLGGDDILLGGDGFDVIKAGAGNDVVRGGASVDNIEGGDGADDLNGGAGGDGLYGESGSDQLSGGDDDDIIAGSFGDDRVEGGAGDDAASGGDGNDTMLGGNGADRLRGIYGADAIAGEGGQDQLTGGVGNDELNGGDGADTFDDRDARMTDPWDYEHGADVIRAGDGNDTVRAGSGDDLVLGGHGNDLLFAGAGEDNVNGHSGHDDIYGEERVDVVYAGAGDDYILGGYGSDKLYGQTDHDVLYGWLAGGDEKKRDPSAYDVLGGGFGKNWCDDGESVKECHVPGWFDKTWIVMANPHGEAGAN